MFSFSIEIICSLVNQSLSFLISSAPGKAISKACFLVSSTESLNFFSSSAYEKLEKDKKEIILKANSPLKKWTRKGTSIVLSMLTIKFVVIFNLDKICYLVLYLD
jgi:hypothetical protein